MPDCQASGCLYAKKRGGMRAVFTLDVEESTYKLLKIIGALGLGRTFNLMWNVYPVMEFVSRNRHA